MGGDRVGWEVEWASLCISCCEIYESNFVWVCVCIVGGMEEMCLGLALLDYSMLRFLQMGKEIWFL